MIRIAEPQFDHEELDAVGRVLASGRLAQGPEVEAFEQEFAEYVGARYGVAVGNGTQALHLALLAHGVGPGDEVLVPAFSFIATASAVVMCGAVPRFVDVCEDTGNLNLCHIGQHLTKRTKAVLPVHLYGHIVEPAQQYGEFPAELHYLEEKNGVIVDVKPVVLLWDACQAHGASFDQYNIRDVEHRHIEYKIGILGTSCWSFYATKNMTTGEGGMVTTNDPDVAARLRLLRSHGQTSRYEHAALGYNYRLTEMQAAIGRVQLRKLPAMQERRHANAAALTAGLQGLDGIALPIVRSGVTHAWHQYTIRVLTGRESRDGLRAYLQEQGIETGVYYPTPLHLQPMFAHLGYRVGDFPVAEKLSAQVLSLPVHPGVSSGAIRYIVEKVRAWIIGEG